MDAAVAKSIMLHLQPDSRRRWLRRYPPTSSRHARIQTKFIRAESSAILLKPL
jgi:hypothetical protein